MDIDEWLGGEFGVDTPKPLKARMITIFQAGVASNVWDLGDVPAKEKDGAMDGPELERTQKFIKQI